MYMMCSTRTRGELVKSSMAGKQAAERIAHGRREGGIVIDVIVSGIWNRPVEGEIGNGEPQRLGARGNHQSVAAAGDDRNRRADASKILGRVHRIAEQEAHRRP